MMAALGLDVGANMTAEERFKQVAAVMKKRDAQDRKEQKDLRRQQKLDKKVICFPLRPLPGSCTSLLQYAASGIDCLLG